MAAQEVPYLVEKATERRVDGLSLEWIYLGPACSPTVNLKVRIGGETVVLAGTGKTGIAAVLNAMSKAVPLATGEDGVEVVAEVSCFECKLGLSVTVNLNVAGQGDFRAGITQYFNPSIATPDHETRRYLLVAEAYATALNMATGQVEAIDSEDDI